MAEGGKVIECQSEEEFNELLKNDKVVLYFSASWCGPCRPITAIVNVLASKYPQVIFVKVDIDNLQSVALKWNVRSVPTLFFMRSGQKVNQIVGLTSPEKIDQLIQELLN